MLQLQELLVCSIQQALTISEALVVLATVFSNANTR